MNCQQIEPMISGYLDNELTQQESQKVRVHVEQCESCRGVYEELKQLKQQINELNYPNTDQELLDKLEQDLIAKTSQGFGWILLALGWLAVTLFGLFLFFQADDIPFIFKLGYGAMIFGGAALFISVLRQRLLTYKKDKYRKVKL